MIVALQPLGNFSKTLQDSVKRGLEKTYNLKIVEYETTAIPQSSFVNIKTPRYRADKLIAFLREVKNDSIDYIMGLTASDISTTKRTPSGKIKEPASKYEDWGIFGLGYRPGPSSIVSSFRLGGSDVQISRAVKIAIHELGHNIGLDHCASKNCVMQDAVESIATIDGADRTLCAVCLPKSPLIFKKGEHN